ncbi:MAG: hypothetical protein CMH28_10550 [Micavibrio sp.]|nr:hypothetical protein [Micavibrio sp.]
MSAFVSNCYIYPLKSACRVELESMTINYAGPNDDRRWMLVHAEGDKRGKFISQRDKGCEKLALVQARKSGSAWVFENPDDSGKLSSHDFERDMFKDAKNPGGPGLVQIWKSELYAKDMGDEAAQWFSNYLGIPVRMVSQEQGDPRKVDPDFSEKGDYVTFADGFPLLITNTASLDSLQPHFAEGANIIMDRFRTNIVIDGLEPFKEDAIHTMQINDTILELVKPCARCVITTIDQDKGAKSSVSEPTKTLGRMRKGISPDLKGVFFGQNAIPRQLGNSRISVGDKVEVLQTRPMHPALEHAALKYVAP